GKPLGFAITPWFLVMGAFWGFAPDIFSFFLNKNISFHSKWFHLHRDNISHSLFLPIIIFAITFLFGGWKISLLISLAVLSHAFLDLYGIGWGVKLFLPFSDKIYKLFYGGKFIAVFKDDRDRQNHIEKFEVDDWFKRDYFSLRRDTYGVPWWWAILEWGSLVLAVILPTYFIIK
ncbi:MAG TPA: metal-dependent hydrolase, partial [Candidatus Methylomirabilis sp.]|nr:metal-dependent hydrolase [Candidatus Methylomirabilis sp.]